MREMLFRAKRLDNGEWAEGNLFIPDKVTRTDVPTEILIGTNIIRISFEVAPSTVGQYTGLTDKNGKQVFEGDIVHVYDATGYCVDYEFEGVVVYQDASFAIQSEDMTHYRWMDYEVEVIGNVHDGKGQDNG